MKSPVLYLAALSACALLIANGAPAHAQTKPTAPPAAGAKPHRQNWLEKMTAEVGLSPTQVSKIKAVEKTRSEKRKAIDNALLTAADRKAKLKVVDDTMKSDVSAILTPAQRIKYAQLEAAQKAARAQASRRP